MNALREGQADGSAELKKHSCFVLGSNQENKIELNLLFIYSLANKSYLEFDDVSMLHVLFVFENGNCTRLVYKVP